MWAGPLIFNIISGPTCDAAVVGEAETDNRVIVIIIIILFLLLLIIIIIAIAMYIYNRRYRGKYKPAEEEVRNNAPVPIESMLAPGTQEKLV